MRAGPLNKWVTLFRNPATESEARGAALSPPGVWCAIEPLPPGTSDTNRAITHLVRMRFHPDVTIDTEIDYDDGRRNVTRVLFVRGFQEVNEAGDEIALLAEEIVP